MVILLAQRWVEDLVEMEGIGPAWWRNNENSLDYDVMFNLKCRWHAFQRKMLAENL